MLNILYLSIISLCIAIVAITYTEIILRSPIATPIWMALRRKIAGKKHLKHLLKPLGECTKCFAGQVALWGYLLIAIDIRACWASYCLQGAIFYRPVFHVEQCSYYLPAHIFFICFSILLADILVYFYNKIH